MVDIFYHCILSSLNILGKVFYTLMLYTTYTSAFIMYLCTYLAKSTYTRIRYFDFFVTTPHEYRIFVVIRNRLCHDVCVWA